jgi:hypothetical protein
VSVVVAAVSLLLLLVVRRCSPLIAVAIVLVRTVPKQSDVCFHLPATLLVALTL